jgi:anti-sigma regulatory factor (Ser/Thr protein kinase)
MQNVHDFISNQMNKLQIAPSEQNKILLACEEIFVNIVNYAYLDSQTIGEISVCLIITNEQIVIKFIDNGKPFNPLEKSDPDISVPLTEREVGGLGIYMLKKLMDEVLYEFNEGQNVLTIIKNR